jgi:hypothetical protein
MKMKMLCLNNVLDFTFKKNKEIKLKKYKHFIIYMFINITISIKIGCVYGS